ncbi:hypothetical protein SNEBB_010669 [Seison nebaliae]|nr:hypothetical protein SNEBB_010669 [Seison nebaliae]
MLKYFSTKPQLKDKEEVKINEKKLEELNLNKYKVKLEKDETLKKGEHVIYESSLIRMVKGVKYFSLGSSLITLACQPYLLPNILSMNNNLFIQCFYGSVSTFFIFITPTLLHMFCRRNLIRLKYNYSNRQFEMTTLSLIGREKHEKFSYEDVNVPAISGPFTLFKVRDRPILAEASEFTDPYIFCRMMKLDEPIDYTKYDKTD